MSIRKVDEIHPPTTHDTWMDSESESNLISVIVPTYNRGHYLPDLIGSVWNQTYRPIELVIVDDGSTDDTESQVRKWKDRHESNGEWTLRYIFQENQGAQVARNRGLVEARGEYIQFLDSDDLIHPRKSEAQVQAFRAHPDADFVWSPIARFRDGRAPEMKQYDLDGGKEEADTFRVETPSQVSHPVGCLFRRSACRKIGPWDENLERYQDWEYSFRIAVLQLFGVNVDRVFYFARDHDTGNLGDRRFGREGIERNLTALSAISRVIDAADTARPELRAVAYRLCLNTLQRSLASGTDQQVRASLQLARRHARKPLRHLRTRTLEFLYALAGKDFARWVLKTYSRVKTGRAPAGNDPQSM